MQYDKLSIIKILYCLSLFPYVLKSADEGRNMVSWFSADPDFMERKPDMYSPKFVRQVFLGQHLAERQRYKVLVCEQREVCYKACAALRKLVCDVFTPCYMVRCDF